jgi:general nucleoside transport system permease protein
MRNALTAAGCVALAVLLCWALLAQLFGVSVAAEAALSLLKGGFGDWPAFFESGSGASVLRPLGESANKAALLLLTGLSVAVAFRVGLFNVGANGQLMVGALCAAVVGASVTLPGLLHVPVALMLSALGGALWAIPAVLLKVKRGVHEVISTIMLNFVAQNLIENVLVVGPLRASADVNNSISGTAQILDSARLPLLAEDASRMHFGVVMATVVAVVLWIFFQKTVRGFHYRVQGLSAPAAEVAGLPKNRLTVEGMALSGALAGLAGAILVLGTELKYPAVLTAQYGFDGIAMALVGGNNPLGVAASAFFFGALRAGGTRLQLLGIHKSFPEVIQGLALLFVAAKIVVDRWLLTRRKAA